jgi:NADH-quinone oxidoreductase subunit E
MKSALSSHLLDEIKALPARYPQPRSAVMPALDLAQEELGYLTPEAMTEVATALQLDAGYVEGVATFYTLFHLEPIGKHRFYVCTNLSCTLRGAEEIVEHLRGAIGVKDAGEVSADGLFSYEEVECMGACEYAPMCRVDHRYHYDLTAEKIDGLVAERRASPAVVPDPPPHPALRADFPGERGSETSPTAVQDPPPHPALRATFPAKRGSDLSNESPASGEVSSAGGAVESAPTPKKPRAPRKKKADG